MTQLRTNQADAGSESCAVNTDTDPAHFHADPDPEHFHADPDPEHFHTEAIPAHFLGDFFLVNPDPK